MGVNNGQCNPFSPNAAGPALSGRAVTDNGMLRQLEGLLRDGATVTDGGLLTNDGFAPNPGADILDRLDAFLARFVAYPNEHARHTNVLWAAHCWFMDCWAYTPRLLFISPEAGSGKTTALKATACLVPRPDFVGDLTPSSLFRSIDESMETQGARPTVLYDELDTVFGNREEGRIANIEMRRLIDIGFDRHATVKRTVRQGGTQTTQRYQVYAPMILAGKMTAEYVPGTIRSRAITVEMQRKAPHERVDRWPRKGGPAEADTLRDLLQLWAELVHQAAHERLPEIPEALDSRDADKWEALLLVAELAGGHWPETARVAAVAAVAASQANAVVSAGVQLLTDVKAIFDMMLADTIFTGPMLAELKAMEISPWAALTPIKMAQLLNGYGVRPKNQRIGERVAKGYRREYFADAWSRYLPQAATPATPATSQGSQ